MAAPTYKAIKGDCLVLMQEAIERGTMVDAIVCDPPYHLQSINKRFAAKGRDETSERYSAGPYGRHAKGFMGKKWDGGDIAFDPATWKLAFDLLKPGGHLIAFGGSRTYHRMACAIEDAGFEIRDQVMWLYGTGFPKSHDVSKGIDKAAGAEREVVGQRRGQGNIPNDRGEWGLKPNTPVDVTMPATKEARQWEGWGTALKPAHEPIVLARKPLEGTVAQNVLKHGVGAINIDATRVGTTTRTNSSKPKAERTGFIKGFVSGTETVHHDHGRWPANVVHDGSDEVEGMLGEPSRFFYCAKAGKADRQGSTHPTVKPVALMRWLVRMVTPPGGTVLDPFAGTGTTGEAAILEGMRPVLMEADETYFSDLVTRMERMTRLNPGSQEKPIRKRARPIRKRSRV